MVRELTAQDVRRMLRQSGERINREREREKLELRREFIRNLLDGPRRQDVSNLVIDSSAGWRN